jgi:hypothetical protein
MAWLVRFHDAFEVEFGALDTDIQEELVATAKLLQDYGPKLGRPHADTLKGSQFSNMKELRFRAFGGVWRVAFAFDPNREGILLVAGDKSGGSESKFYKRLIAKADERYGEYLAAAKKKKE